MTTQPDVSGDSGFHWTVRNDDGTRYSCHEQKTLADAHAEHFSSRSNRLYVAKSNNGECECGIGRKSS